MPGTENDAHAPAAEQGLDLVAWNLWQRVALQRKQRRMRNGFIWSREQYVKFGLDVAQLSPAYADLRQ